MNTNDQRPYLDDSREESVDVKQLLFKFLRYWYFFAITVFVALIVAFLFNKYTKPVYEVSSTVLIQDTKKGGMADVQSLLGVGFGNSQQNLQNEIGVLNSNSLVVKAVKSMNQKVSYFSEDNFITSELYKTSPITVIPDTTHPQPANIKFYISIKNTKQFEIRADGENAKLYDFSLEEFYTQNDQEVIVDRIDLNKSYSFGETIETKFLKFKVLLNFNYNSDKHLNQKIFFQFNDLPGQVAAFKNYKIEPINREASILEIKLKGNSVEKSVDFLNTLTNEYLARGLNKKNMIAIKTIEFIDRELIGIRDSLTLAEVQLENFRRDNQIMQLDVEAQQVFEYMKDLDKQKAELLMKGKYYKYLKTYIEERNDIDDLVVPSSMGVEDPLLTQLLADLTHLHEEKSALLLTSTRKNPAIGQIESKIKNAKANLVENIKNIVNTSNIAIRDIEERIVTQTAKISSLPSSQRELLSFERKFDLNNNLYTFLLQRRAEAQITKASNLPDNEIVDEAISEGKMPVYPKKSLNYLIALLLGLILPAIYIYLKDYLNDKIMDRSDVERATHYPLVGVIMHNNRDSKLVVAESPKSSIAGSFRSVRTNLLYMAKGNEKQTILVTSDMVAAGKTFISTNLATIYALNGRRTLLIGFDLRKPKIFQEFGLSNTEGASSYLIGKSQLNKIIHKTFVENLDILLAGPVPPIRLS
ncbi:MAG: hypothetical protein CVU06_01545 [Bacteroidetes bacterium HGW-Bacteroidetes-22]|nr:MAG: hypothetical protein CVU06_01545 [Bacteroidetes bacterium HGW-Bacteroidetes-22]